MKKLALALIILVCGMAFTASGDLVLDKNSVTFSSKSPTEGDAVTITAEIQNLGNVDVGEDIEVRFIEGDPEKGGLQIGSDALVLGLKAGASKKAEIKWRAAPGKVNIRIVIDPDNMIKEAKEDNNSVIVKIEGKKWKGPKASKADIERSIKKGVEWLKTQQGEFYVTCPNGHDNFLYSALAYGKCIICSTSLDGKEPERISDPVTFILKPEFEKKLKDGKLSAALQTEFENNQAWVYPSAVLSTETEGKRWLITDEENRRAMSVTKDGGKLVVRYEEFMPGGWLAEIGPGMTSLIIMTLLHSDVDVSDPAVVNGIDHLFNKAPVTWYNWTDPYEYASGILALTATGDKEKYMEKVEYATKKLVALQTVDGGWGYGSVADAAHLQYVMMGLYAAKQWGVDIPADTWTRAVAWLTGMQREDGGWNYYSSGSGPFAEDSYGSMTATAVLGLKAAGIPPTSKSVKRGIDWLEKYYSVTRNPGSFYWHYYYLVALQRALDVPPGQSKLGKHEWYPEIASFLISKQQADGSWVAATPIYTTSATGEAPTIASWGADRGDVMASAFAVLFLSRAMPKSAAPDVGFGPKKLIFSKNEPQDGEQITITASVSNTGALPLENVEVQFYNGAPDAGGVPVGDMQELPSISIGETKEVSINWKATGTGLHRIYTVIDPANTIRESNEEDNTAYGEIKVGGESTPTIPAMVKLGNNLFKLGNIDLDLNEKTLSMPGKINMSYGLIELLACTSIGKLHESALVIDVQPIHLNTALILMGLEPPKQNNVRYQGDPITPKGAAVQLWIEWDADNQTQRYRAEDLILNRAKQSHMEYTSWIFTGSRFNNGVFMSQAVGTLIATFRDPDAIINNPLPDGADDTIYIVNSRIAPPKGTDIRMIIAPVGNQS